MRLSTGATAWSLGASLATLPLTLAHAHDPPKPVEVVVRGDKTPAERLRKSAEAVDVVDAKRSRERARSVGDVLARTQGVAVRRVGGLGSETSLSLNGLSDRQIPIFLDGVPLDIAGFPQGLGNVPISLVERVEIYRGVVPLRFGAEALGGAINLVTDPSYYRNVGSVALERGSFGVYRGSAIGRWVDPKRGITAQVTGYGDRASNRYLTLVEVPDARGRNTVADVPRFHDGYAARGLSIESGLIDRPYAKKLLLRLSYNAFEKELQHNVIQAVPYGEATVGEASYGAVLRYEQPGLFGRNTSFEGLAAVARRAISFQDLSPFVYDWYGRRVARRGLPGETSNTPRDQTFGEPTLFGRAIASWTPSSAHELRIALTVRSTSRSGRNAAVAPGGYDPTTADSRLTTLVSGVEHVGKLWDERLTNIASAKLYAYDSSIDENLLGGRQRRLGQDERSIGYGDAVRLQFAKAAALKISYERTVRFPHPDELFGNGALIRPSTGLTAEKSDNGNLGIEVRTGPLGPVRLTGGASGFVRLTDNQIVLLGDSAGTFQHENVLSTRISGVESHVQAALFSGHLLIDGNFTYQEVINRAEAGPFAPFRGDRLPHRPYLFANAGASYRVHDCLSGGDLLALGGDVRFVKSFLLGWESAGDARFKLGVPDQLVSDVFVSYAVGSRPRFTTAFEVQNVGDARAYDYYGVQRPRRGAALKLIADF